MARGNLTFRQSDLVRAWRAARAQGLDIVRTEITPDGRLAIYHRLDAKKGTDDETYEEWKARTGASAS